MRRAVAAVAVLGLLVGCSSSEKPTAAPTPAPPANAGGTVPVPTNTLSTEKPTDAAEPPQLPEEATAPPPAAAGPVSAKNLPAAAKLGTGWKTYTDPGGAEAGFQGNETWTRQREAHQAAFEALPIGCAKQLPKDSLPVPEHALQGSYRTGGAKPATALVLRFGDSGKATAYYRGYQARMTACGNDANAQLAVQSLWSEDTAAASVRRYAGAEAYVEVSVVQGATVTLLAAESAAPDGETAWTHSVVPELRAVIDAP